MGRPCIIPRRVIEGMLENLFRLEFFLSHDVINILIWLIL